jgi:very-short-patch-repair endonuclease
VNTHAEGIEVDFHWPDRKLVVEIDGPHHRRKRTRREDVLSDRILRAAGYRVVRIPDDELEHEPDRVIARLRAGA